MDLQATVASLVTVNADAGRNNDGPGSLADMEETKQTPCFLFALTSMFQLSAVSLPSGESFSRKLSRVPGAGLDDELTS